MSKKNLDLACVMQLPQPPLISQEMRHQTDGVLENIQIEQDQLKAKETAITEAIQRYLKQKQKHIRF